MRKSFELEKKTIVLMGFDKRYKYYMNTLGIANDDSHEMQKLAIKICKYIEEHYPDTPALYTMTIRSKACKIIDSYITGMSNSKASQMRKELTEHFMCPVTYKQGGMWSYKSLIHFGYDCGFDEKRNFYINRLIK
jgi:hypothetical protein